MTQSSESVGKIFTLSRRQSLQYPLPLPSLQKTIVSSNTPIPCLMIAGLLKPGGLTCRRLCISGIRWWFPFFSLFATQPLPLLLHAPLLLVHPVRAFHIPPQATSDHYSRATPTTFFSKIMPSTRVKSTKSSEELDEKMNTVEESDAVASVTPPSTSSPKKKRRKNAAAATDSEELPTVDDGPGTSSPKKKAKTTKNKPKKKATTTGSDSESDGEGIPNAKKTAATKKTRSPKTKKAAEHQRITDRDEIPKLWNDDMAMANGSYSELLFIQWWKLDDAFC
jgi:hypothetical protein